MPDQAGNPQGSKQAVHHDSDELREYAILQAALKNCSPSPSVRKVLRRVVERGETWDDLRKEERSVFGVYFEKAFVNKYKLHGVRNKNPRKRTTNADLAVDGIEVDIKCSTSSTASWMIPTQSVATWCLLVRYDHRSQTCSMGLLKANIDRLTPSKNGDSKRGVTVVGKQHIFWLFQDVPV